ncbi:DLW-39 family protein [Arthrobacter cryoconiti]|uniref:DLW-39 family protein n=1 Tax=Arthrobacter cryoconiti TaxID=748907 RepID=A0ABV8R2H6_9MICC|nr:DLW-39 family protein [Arthrobacter cryoconiti]MCC9067783.1 DLW-39 family protein [Arthrobacter cryoconiti]
MKRLLIVASALGAALFLKKKYDESKVVKATWSKATDTVK